MAGKLTRWNIKLNASERRESLVDGGPKAFSGSSGATLYLVGDHFTRLGFHRTAVYGGAHLQLPLDLIIEIANRNGCHEIRIA
jgi:hypothetical protein